jgi:4-alpha-glucanotransferase
MCTSEISAALIKVHLSSPAMLTMITLPDLLGMDPALRHPDPSAERGCVRSAEVRGAHVWRYRCHVLLEELQQAHTFTSKVREMVAQAQRQAPLPVKGAGRG